MHDKSICPCCGAQMTEGHLNSAGHRILWTEDEQISCAMPHEGDLVVAPLSVTGKSHNTAYLCPECGCIIVTDYHDKKTKHNVS